MCREHGYETQRGRAEQAPYCSRPSSTRRTLQKGIACSCLPTSNDHPPHSRPAVAIRTPQRTEGLVALGKESANDRRTDMSCPGAVHVCAAAGSGCGCVAIIGASIMGESSKSTRGAFVNAVLARDCRRRWPVARCGERGKAIVYEHCASAHRVELVDHRASGPDTHRPDVHGM